MKNTLIALVLGLSCSYVLAADEVPAHPYIEIVTTEGTIVLELDGKQAPLTVGHILELVDSGFYESNIRGTIAMARTGDPHSANSQFFINVGDNSRLDPNKKGGSWGYTVFGSVIQGMDVVDKIATSRTGPAGPFPSDVPVVPIVIKKMSRYTFE